jgi:hypothetical protein
VTIVSLMCSVASDSWLSTICCDAKECQNTNLLHTTFLCKGLFIIVVLMMMMEIIMNPMSVPKTTARLDFNVVRLDVSPMNRAVATEFIACQKVIYRLYFTDIS